MKKSWAAPRTLALQAGQAKQSLERPRRPAANMFSQPSAQTYLDQAQLHAPIVIS